MQQTKIFFFRSLEKIKFPLKIVFLTVKKYKANVNFVTFPLII